MGMSPSWLRPAKYFMWTVYKITNKVNQKTYIGVHKTIHPNDSYMGSGVAIKNAIKKYGRENFLKEIILITEDKNEAFSKEKELTIDFFKVDNYNMKLGGVGGFTRDNSVKGRKAIEKKFSRVELAKLGGQASVEQKKGYHGLTKEQLSENGRKGGLSLKGKPKSEEHKQKLRESWAAKKLR